MLNSVGRKVGDGIVIVPFVPMILTAGPAEPRSFPSVGLAMPEVAIPVAGGQKAHLNRRYHLSMLAQRLLLRRPRFP